MGIDWKEGYLTIEKEKQNVEINRMVKSLEEIEYE
jgi:hypothetical protein